ncbi:MAG: ATP-binding protein [Candidatus Hodarchaeota archaeon]
MIVSIASGKGGTGKTTIAVNLALSIKDIQLLDCDVEEPNVHLLLPPDTIDTKPVYARIPVVDESKCNYCGECAKFCEFNALFVANQRITFFPELCNGCGGCLIICPQNAIKEKKRKIGMIKMCSTEEIRLIWGELSVGEPMATPVIRAVKDQMRPLEKEDIIIDSPPGTSCPVIEAIYGSDYTILVTEPNPFGLYDLKIAVEVLGKLGIPFGIVINKAGIGDKKVQAFCRERAIPILLEVPHTRRIAELYSIGRPFVLEMQEWKAKFSDLFNRISESI